MKPRYRLAMLLRPLIRALPRAKSIPYRLIGAEGFHNPHWKSVPHPRRVFYDRVLRAHIQVDLGDWSGRLHYFYGYYFDHANRLLMDTWLRPGDWYVDVGANFGWHALYASLRVGPQGAVFAFEPNPAVFRLLDAHAALNDRANIRTFPYGISDESGELEMTSPDESPSRFTMRKVENGVPPIRVPVRRLDDLLPPVPEGRRVLLKVDVEGFEEKVLRGAPRLLAHPDLILSMEINDAHLRAAGSSAARVFSLMQESGWQAQRLEFAYAGLTRRRLDLAPLPAPTSERMYDVVWSRRPL